jgi:monofunctional biosynthetic peptidoglycan transglycosylase
LLNLVRGRLALKPRRSAIFKPASKLTASEAALLAAVLPNPIRFRADAPSGYVRSRQAWILRQMRQLGGEGFMQANKLH